MKSKYILLLALFWLLATNAAAMTITAGPATKAPNGKRHLPITLSDLGETPVESVAGTAFTLEFDTDALNLESVSSDFFAPFEAQFTKAKTQPAPEIPALQKSPVIWNEIDGTGAAIAGARCIATSSTKTLFNLTFALKPGADAESVYPIKLRPTTLTDTNAGYTAEGETIPVLIGGDANAAAHTPEAYPVLVDGQASGATIQNGQLSFQAAVNDSDGDGMDDDWEIKHFGNTTTAGIDTDSDGDGISDREEYQNSSNPGDTLPVLLAVSSACVANTAEATLTLQGERLTLFPIKQVVLKKGDTKTALTHKNTTAESVDATLPKGLSEGDYTLEILFANGAGDGSFTITNPEISVTLYTPLALSELPVPSDEALNAIDTGASHSDGSLTGAQLNALGLGSMAGKPGVKVTLEEKPGKPRALMLRSETGIKVSGGTLPLATSLTTPESDAVAIEIRLEDDTRITAGGAPYAGAVNPPRAMVLLAKKKESLSTLLGVTELVIFSAGNDRETLTLSKPALVFLEVAAPADAIPTVFYLDGSGSNKTPAGIDGPADIDGNATDIATGGTVIETTTIEGKTIHTIAVLLDHFSSYAVGWSEDSDTQEKSGGSGGCFINTLRP